jgi:hypothetical protein
MVNPYKVEAYPQSVLEESESDDGETVLESRINELAKNGWKVITMSSDDEGYVVIYQRTRARRQGDLEVR